MNHQRSLAVTTPSRKSGIARTVSGQSGLEHHTRNFVFQNYAEDGELEHEMSSCPQSIYGRQLRDKRLLEEVYEQVALQDHLETRDLRLDVSNGVVVLQGSVSDHAMKVEIAKVVQQCSSVMAIVNHIASPGAQLSAHMSAHMSRE